MKPHRAIIFGLLALQASSGEQLAEMDNEMLARAFNGWTVPGYTGDKLKAELGGSGSLALIQKCKGDSRLMKALPGFPCYLAHGPERDELIGYILEEPQVWYSDEGDKLRFLELSAMQAMGFVDSVVRKEFFMASDDEDIPRLGSAIRNGSTRYFVADLFKRVASLDESQRKEGSPEMEALVAELRETLKRLEKAEIGIGGGQPLPRRSSDSGQNPSRTPPIDQSSEAPLADPAVLIEKEPRLMLRWIGAVAATIVVFAAGIAFFRSRAARR